jgi:hypothetical protein
VKVNYHGVILPFNHDEDEDGVETQLMLRIIPEMNQPFNTKMRAPFKIICETVTYKELYSIEHGLPYHHHQLTQNQGLSSDGLTNSQQSDEPARQIKISMNDGEETWENVSIGDADLDGMADPFLNKFKHLARHYSKVSEYANKYQSWRLR